MLEGDCGYDGRTYRVASRCEVVVSDMSKPPSEWKYCGKPTSYFYPSAKGGTMPLCAEHGEKHLPHGAWAVERKKTPLSDLPHASEKGEG